MCGRSPGQRGKEHGSSGNHGLHYTSRRAGRKPPESLTLHEGETTMAAPLKAFNLKRWIDEHRDLLRPPVGAEMIWKDSEFVIMIIGGPNARRDFHINPGD